MNFQFNQTVTGSFGTSGIYTVQFSPDWNTILNITFVSTLPSNRQYVYTTMNTTPLSYYITSSADSNSIITPSGNVMVNANFSQTFTYSANSGYTIDSVLVDGSSVPITGSYTFNNVQANHTISVESTLNPPQITNVQLPLVATQIGFMMPISVTITNSDSESETAVIQVTANSTSVFNATATLNSLQTLTIPCYFNTGILAVGNYCCTVTLTTMNQTGVLNTEMATGNIGVTYLGDFNGDFKVDSSDFFYFTSAYVQYWTTGTLDPACDLNHDGIINGQTFFAFVTDYIAYWTMVGTNND